MATNKKNAATDVLLTLDTVSKLKGVPVVTEDPGNNLPDANFISEALDDWERFKKKQLEELGEEKFSRVIEP